MARDLFLKASKAKNNRARDANVGVLRVLYHVH